MTFHVDNVLNHVPDEAHVEKCFVIWEEFWRTTQASSRMCRLTRLGEIEELQEPLETRMMYAILLRALRRFELLEDCREPCCAPFRPKLRECQWYLF